MRITESQGWVEIPSVGDGQKLVVNHGDFWVRVGGTQPAASDRGFRLRTDSGTA